MSCTRLPVPALLALIAASTGADAQTCASPWLLFTDIPLSASTCGQPNSLPFISPGWSSPQPDFVMSFNAAAWLGGHLQLQGDFDAAFALLLACDDNTEPVRVGVPPAQIDLTGLAPGTWFVVATGHPESPQDTCGNFVVTAYTFVIDDIFSSGFEARP